MRLVFALSLMKDRKMLFTSCSFACHLSNHHSSDGSGLFPFKAKGDKFLDFFFFFLTQNIKTMISTAAVIIFPGKKQKSLAEVERKACGPTSLN